MVVLVLGIVATISTTAMTGPNDGRRVNAASDALESTLEGWSEHARITSADHIVVFDQTAETCSFYLGTAADEDALVDRIDFGARPYRVDLRTQSDARDDRLLKISDFGWVTGSLKLRLVSGGFQSTLQVPF